MNTNQFPKLVNVTFATGGLSLEIKQRHYQKAVSKNFNAWVKYYSHPQRPHSKDLTTYANQILETKLIDLYNLVIDYSGNRTYITKRKHEVLKNIRANRQSNVYQQLKEMLLNEYHTFRKAGAMRNSDSKIISKIK